MLKTIEAFLRKFWVVIGSLLLTANLYVVIIQWGFWLFNLFATIFIFMITLDAWTSKR